MRTGERGLTYLGLLAVLALLGASLAQLGQAWSTQAQRGREAELRFRGEQIRDAIGRYRAARQPAQWPPSLEALLDDRRDGVAGAPRQHLRRLWTDPFTGRADWELLPPPPPAPGPARATRNPLQTLPAAITSGQPAVAGVRSRAENERITDAATAAEKDRPRVSDWRFLHRLTPAQPPAAASAPGGKP